MLGMLGMRGMRGMRGLRGVVCVGKRAQCMMNTSWEVLDEELQLASCVFHAGGCVCAVLRGGTARRLRVVCVLCEYLSRKEEVQEGHLKP